MLPPSLKSIASDYSSDCSRECQVGDWNDHKEDCIKFQVPGCKRDKKFIKKFFAKHQHLINQKVKAVSLETGLKTMELFIELDFSDSGHDIAPPAVRDIPEFKVLPAKNLLNRGEDKVSQNCLFCNEERITDLNVVGFSIYILQQRLYQQIHRFYDCEAWKELCSCFFLFHG